MEKTLSVRLSFWKRWSPGAGAMCLSLLCALTLSGTAYGQQMRVTGTVMSSTGTPLQDVTVQLGSPALPHSSPDFDPLTLANAVYGANGSLDTRLFREVRERRGLVYGASSALVANRDRGTFTISFSAVPSKIDAAVSGVWTAISVRSSRICAASSRVGVRTSARVVPRGFAINLWRMGSRNAAVLPLPVMAQASRSRPSRAGGMASA